MCLRSYARHLALPPVGWLKAKAECRFGNRQTDAERVQASNQSVRKEVIQPQVPLRLPCYDLVPITELAFGAVLPKVRHSDFERSPLSWLDGRCVQGSGTYSPRHG